MFSFPMFIRESIEAAGETQAAFAEKIGVSLRVLTSWLESKGFPGDEALAAMDKALSLPPGTLKAHKELLRLKREGLDLRRLIAPEVLAEHGIDTGGKPAPALSRQAQHAVSLVESGQWPTLARWALDQFNKAGADPWDAAPGRRNPAMNQHEKKS
jgi:transcriptional regulator with XRE-family HTH domain